MLPDPRYSRWRSRDLRWGGADRGSTSVSLTYDGMLESRYAME